MNTNRNTYSDSLGCTWGEMDDFVNTILKKRIENKLRAKLEKQYEDAADIIFSGEPNGGR